MKSVPRPLLIGMVRSTIERQEGLTSQLTVVNKNSWRLIS